MATSDRHLSNSEFLSRLPTLFPPAPTTTDPAKPSHGTVFISQKPFIPSPSASSSEPAPGSTTPGGLIVRASDGQSSPSSQFRRHKAAGLSDKVARENVKPKTKFSTVVTAEDLEGFFGRLGDVCKEGMGRGLKRRDRKKAKAKGKGKKKGKGGGVAAGTSKTS